MKTEQQSQAGVAYSIPFASRDYGYDLELPSNVSGFSDLRKNVKSNSRTQQAQMVRLYTEIKNLLSNYEEFTEETIEEISDDELEISADEIRESLEHMKSRNNQSKKLIKANEDLLRTHPSVANDLINHHLLAETYINVAQEIDEEVGFEKILEEEDVNLGQEEYQLNLFLALEPYLVVCVLRADAKGDDEFLDLYQKLFDKFSFYFSRRMPDVFEKIVDFEELKLDEKEFEHFIEEIELDEMYG